MHTEQLSWSKPTGWHNGSTSPLNGSASPRHANLVLYFGARDALASGSRYHELRAMFPDAHIMGCSTGGQISNDDVTDDEMDDTEERATGAKPGASAAPTTGNGAAGAGSGATPAKRPAAQRPANRPGNRPGPRPRQPRRARGERRDNRSW